MNETLPCTIYFDASEWSSRFGKEHFTLSIDNVEAVENFAVYHILIKYGNEVKDIDKRYSDFCHLHNMLEKENIAVNNLPPKTCSPHGSIKAEFLERRRRALELYFISVVKNSPNAVKISMKWLAN